MRQCHLNNTHFYFYYYYYTNYHIVMKWSLAAGIGMEIIMFLYITGDITELFNLLGLLRIIFL